MTISTMITVREVKVTYEQNGILCIPYRGSKGNVECYMEAFDEEVERSLLKMGKTVGVPPQQREKTVATFYVSTKKGHNLLVMRVYKKDQKIVNMFAGDQVVYQHLRDVK